MQIFLFEFDGICLCVGVAWNLQVQYLNPQMQIYPYTQSTASSVDYLVAVVGV